MTFDDGIIFGVQTFLLLALLTYVGHAVTVRPLLRRMWAMLLMLALLLALVLALCAVARHPP